MKGNKTLIIRTLKLISIILLYYIIGTQNIFLYTLSICLYNILTSCFNHISFFDTSQKIEDTHTLNKIFKILLLIISVISLFLALLSVLVSDVTSIFLKINNILPIFIFMGISIITKPLIKLISEYLTCLHKNSNYLKFIDIYNILDYLLLLVIALFSFRVFNLKTINAISSLYLSKIISMIIVINLIYYVTKSQKIIIRRNNINVNCKKEIKKILTNNSYKSTINIVKNSYYYISVIVLYAILSTRYNYLLDDLEKTITFIYFFNLELMDYIIYIIKKAINKTKEILLTDKIYHSFKIILPITIVISIISPLLCKIIYNNPDNSLYLTMISFMSIFILIYDVVYENIKNKKIIYISLIIGLIIKAILVIPLINSFYRTGYNLIYGDIVSTCIAMFVSILINYIYLKTITSTKEKYIEKALNILYDNIILSIILILLQFVIPIDTTDYFRALGIMTVYIIISIAFILIKNKKRG